MKNSLKCLQKENENFKVEICSIKKSKEILQNDKTNLKFEISSIKNSKESLQNENANLRLKNTSLKNSMESLQNENENFRVKLKSDKGKESYEAIFQMVSALEEDINTSSFSMVLRIILEIIKKNGLLLTTLQINILFGKLLDIFNNFVKRNLPKNSGWGENTKHVDYSTIKLSEEFSNVIGCLCNTNLELTLDLVCELFNKHLPRFFDNDSTFLEKMTGLLILKYIVDYLGQIHLKIFWTDICKLFLKFLDNDDNNLRYHSVKGLEKLVEKTNEDFNLYIEEILKGFKTAVEYNKYCWGATSRRIINENFGWGYEIQINPKIEAQLIVDTAISAIGKIIHDHPAYLNEKVWIPTWFSYLPLISNSNESKAQKELVCQVLICENCRSILFNDSQSFPKIINILAEIYDTQNTTNLLNKHILTVVEYIKNDPSLLWRVEIAKQSCQGNDRISKTILLFFP
jgi:FtsZ-binding cell division protein ZapB